MKNLVVGFVIGYLVCTFVLGGAGAVGNLVEESFSQVTVWYNQAVDMFNNYEPKG